MKLNELKTKYRKTSKEIQEKVDRDLAFQTGLQVERLRLHKGLTQERLALMIKTKQSSISRVESGSVLPSLGFLKKIADALGVYLAPPTFIISDGNLKDTTVSSKEVSTDEYLNSTESPYVQTYETHGFSEDVYILNVV